MRIAPVVLICAAAAVGGCRSIAFSAADPITTEACNQEALAASDGLPGMFNRERVFSVVLNQCIAEQMREQGRQRAAGNR